MPKGWLANGYDVPEIMTYFIRDSVSVSAKCGGWCGECLPDGDIFLAKRTYTWSNWGNWGECSPGQTSTTRLRNCTMVKIFNNLCLDLNSSFDN